MELGKLHTPCTKASLDGVRVEASSPNPLQSRSGPGFQSVDCLGLLRTGVQLSHMHSESSPRTAGTNGPLEQCLPSNACCPSSAQALAGVEVYQTSCISAAAAWQRDLTLGSRLKPGGISFFHNLQKPKARDTYLRCRASVGACIGEDPAKTATALSFWLSGSLWKHCLCKRHAAEFSLR